MAETIIAKDQDWFVDTIRFTGFLTPDINIKEPNWWEIIVGEIPETRTIEPRFGNFLEKGLYGEGELVISISPLRIDLIYRSIFDHEAETKKALGSFPKVVDIFKLLLEKWYSVQPFPTFQRIAFGSILLYPVKDHGTGYEVLSKYLKDSVKVDPIRSSDFIYQVNRPRISKIESTDLKFNRLMKWSVLKSNFLQFVLEAGNKRVVPGQESFACNLELDINTSQEQKLQLSTDNCKSIFDELVNLGLEISKKGDIK